MVGPKRVEAKSTVSISPALHAMAIVSFHAADSNRQNVRLDKKFQILDGVLSHIKFWGQTKSTESLEGSVDPHIITSNYPRLWTNSFLR
jgi:hypothetical protein